MALGGLCVAVAPHQLDDAIAWLHAIDEGWTRPASPLALWRRVSPLTALLAFFLLLVSPPPRIRGEYLWRIREDRAYSAR